METIKSLTGYTYKQITSLSEIAYRQACDELEDQNQHGAHAVMQACRLGNQNSATALLHLNAIHNLIGHMTTSMIDLRTELARTKNF